MYVCAKIKKITIYVVLGIFFLGFMFIVKSDSNVIYSNSIHQDKGIFLPVIMYHSILKDESRQGDYVISPTVFESDMIYIKDRGFNSVTVQDLVNYVYEDVPLPQNPIMITFDDGFYNNITYALPILEKYNIKAVISVIGSYSENYSASNDLNPAYAYVTWDNIKDMSTTGLIEIGNHTYDMHSSSRRKGCDKLWNESEEEYKKVFTDDIMMLQKELTEKSDVTPQVFAYPFGFLNKQSVSILKELGFKATLNCYEKPNYITKDPDTLFGINRYNRANNLSTNEFMQKILTR